MLSRGYERKETKEEEEINGERWNRSNRNSQEYNEESGVEEAVRKERKSGWRDRLEEWERRNWNERENNTFLAWNSYTKQHKDMRYKGTHSKTSFSFVTGCNSWREVHIIYLYFYFLSAVTFITSIFPLHNCSLSVLPYLTFLLLIPFWLSSWLLLNFLLRSSK